MSSVKQLYELQECDLKVSAIEKALADVRARLADNSAVEATRHRLSRLQATLDVSAVTRREVEREVQPLKDKLSDLQAKLFGGNVTRQREMEALQEEGAFTQGQLSQSEDRLLQLMVDMEEGQAERGRLAETLSRLTAERSTQVAALHVEEQRLVQEWAKLAGERSAAAQAVPPVDLARYESLRRSRGGQAVARVAGGHCQACRVSLPSGELQRARSGHGIVQCSSCRRILYAP